MDIETLTKKLEKAWSRESSQRPTSWGPGNPAWGQSDATALVVKCLLGGRIMRCRVRTPDGRTYVQYFNVTYDEVTVDMTLKQYPWVSWITHERPASIRWKSAIRRATLLMSALDSSESRNL